MAWIFIFPRILLFLLLSLPWQDGFGGGDELSHNLVFSTCRESGDHGPFNSPS